MKNIATEYEVRDIDASGDAIDVYSFDSEADALAQADKLTGKALAVAVEKHTYNRDFFCRLQDAVNEYEIRLRHVYGPSRSFIACPRVAPVAAPCGIFRATIPLEVTGVGSIACTLVNG